MTEELLDAVYERIYDRLPSDMQRDLDEDPWKRLALKFGLLQDYLRMKAEEN